MPVPLLVVVGIAFGLGLGVGVTVAVFWEEIKRFIVDLSTALYRTAKRSINALKMIAKGLAEDDIFSGEYTLMKKGSDYILETFVYEFEEVSSWKPWESDKLEHIETYSKQEVIKADNVPDDIKRELTEKLEIRESLELGL